MPETFGSYLAAARKGAGLTLRAVGERLGLSVPYLHDIEHDRRSLPSERWTALVAALPGVTLRGLAEARVATGPVEIDARALAPKHRAAIVDGIMEALAAEAA